MDTPLLDSPCDDEPSSGPLGPDRAGTRISHRLMLWWTVTTDLNFRASTASKRGLRWLSVPSAPLLLLARCGSAAAPCALGLLGVEIAAVLAVSARAGTLRRPWDGGMAWEAASVAAMAGLYGAALALMPPPTALTPAHGAAEAVAEWIGLLGLVGFHSSAVSGLWLAAAIVALSHGLSSFSGLALSLCLVIFSGIADYNTAVLYSELRCSRRSTQVLLQHTTDGFCTVDPVTGDVRNATSLVDQLCGRDPDETIRFFDLFQGSDQIQMQDVLSAALSDETFSPALVSLSRAAPGCKLEATTAMAVSSAAATHRSGELTLKVVPFATTSSCVSLCLQVLASMTPAPLEVAAASTPCPAVPLPPQRAEAEAQTAPHEHPPSADEACQTDFSLERAAAPPSPSLRPLPFTLETAFEQEPSLGLSAESSEGAWGARSRGQPGTTNAQTETWICWERDGFVCRRCSKPPALKQRAPAPFASARPPPLSNSSGSAASSEPSQLGRPGRRRSGSFRSKEGGTGGGDGDGTDGEPQGVVPEWEPTKAHSAALSLLFTMKHWNLPHTKIGCCPFHASVLLAKGLVKRILKDPCNPAWAPLSGWQCRVCTCMNHESVPRCDMCGAINTSAPASEEDPDDVTTSESEQQVISVKSAPQVSRTQSDKDFAGPAPSLPMRESASNPLPIPPVAKNHILAL